MCSAPSAPPGGASGRSAALRPPPSGFARPAVLPRPLPAVVAAGAGLLGLGGGPPFAPQGSLSGSGCRRLASPVARLRAPPPRPGPWPVLRAGPRRARSLALGVGLGLLRGPWRAPCAALRPPPLRAPSLAGPPALRPLRGPAGPLRGSASGLPGSSRRAGLAALRAACSAPPRPAAGVGLTRAAASAPPGTAPPPACTGR